MTKSYVEREEFDHFINEFEVTRDSILDEITKLVQEVELINDELKTIKESIIGQSQVLHSKKLG
jgi:hypothetical protein